MRKDGRRSDRRRMLIFFASGAVLLVTFAILVKPFFTTSPPIDTNTANEADPTPESIDLPGLVDPFIDGEPQTLQDSQDVAHGLAQEVDEKWIVRLDSAHEAQEHVLITSDTTADGNWFQLDWGKDYDGFNPNFVPHPVRNDTWYMLAVALQSTLSGPTGIAAPVYSVELYCEAQFTNGNLTCLKSPLQVPIASTVSEKCTGNLNAAHLIIGPAESRVFVGKDNLPYIMYVSPSIHACSGPHLQDLRRLIPWYTFDAINLTNHYFFPVDLQRPPPRNHVEKNWFIFWDEEGDMYTHFDIYPKRAFSRMDADGSGAVGSDLAPLAFNHDRQCMDNYMPRLEGGEHIHQATNSLALVLCKRSDPSCVPSSENTVIMAIFQHKKYDGHNLYEPYVMLFNNYAPFHVHGISSQPLWISGRGKPGWSNHPEINGQSQMMYIQSINWKEKGVGYRGYLDDVVMVAFGIEDSDGGGIDVVAEQLVRGMALCDQSTRRA